MKYAFLSDIHSNLAALNEVVKDMKGKAEKIVVLGDIVGYGPKLQRFLNGLGRMQMQLYKATMTIL